MCTAILAHHSCAVAQPDRQSYLATTPLAEIDVQALETAEPADYTEPNPLIMYQPRAEDILSFYVRTQDGEWKIPRDVDQDDPWVRLLVLGPVRPTIVDIAIEINGEPYRAAREAWIDKLLAEAEATFLVRTGAATAESAGFTANDSAEAPTDGDGEQIAGKDQNDDEIAAGGDSDPADASEEIAVSEDEPSMPMVSAQGRQTSSLFKRLINYLAADQTQAEREEVRWLLAEWTGGPAQLTLTPAFAWRRASSAPLWHCLDVNSDHILDREEISSVSESLRQADINRDEILDLGELERLASDRAAKRTANGYPLVVVIDAETDWDYLVTHLRLAYPHQATAEVSTELLDRIANGDKSVGAAELANLMSLTPDLVYRVQFDSDEASAQLLGVNGAPASEASARWRFQSATERAITVERTEAYMELTAAQGEIDEENASGDMQQTQVAIGAVVDGYPLLRLVDHDNNRQLTQRERLHLVELLQELDHDQDGQVSESEVPTPIRLAVTHGPFAHQQLARATAAQRAQAGADATGEVPAWFVGMDRNRDGDLSKREFQGSPAQFAQFDKDQDGLISRREVLAAEAKN